VNAAALAAGASVGAGLALVVRGLVPPRPPLAETIATLQRPRAAAAPGGVAGAVPGEWQRAGWAARAGRPVAGWLSGVGLPTARIRADLSLLDRPAEVHLAEQATSAIIGALLGPALGGILAAAGAGIGWVLPLWGCLALAAVGFVVPTFVVRANAAERRVEFTHALGAFLDLVVIGLAGGAGVDAALTEASRVGHGWAFDRLRHTLHVARITRTTPWAALAELGDVLQVPVLREVAASVGLAGTEGARVRSSLAAKASALRLRELTAAEAAAVAATEQMSLPVIVMFAGFLVFIGFPAAAHVLISL
jgi:tight adherence protein C